MWFYKKILLSFLLLLCNANALIDFMEQSQSLNSHIQYLSTTAAKDYNEALSYDSKIWSETSFFKPIQEDYFYWAKVDLKLKAGSYYFEIVRPYLKDFKLFVLIEQQLQDSVAANRSLDAKKNTYEHWSFVHEIKVEKTENITLLFRFKDPHSLTLPMKLWTKKAFHTNNHELSLLYGLLSGLIIGMALLSFLSYLNFRDKTYFNYIFVIISAVAFVVFYSGFGTKYFIPSAWEEKLGFLPFLLLLLLLVCLLSFTREYAKTAEKHPLWDMVLKYYSYGLLAISFLGTLFFRAFIMKFAAYFSLVGLLLFLLPGILVRRKNSNFNWLFFSLSPPIIVGLLMTLQRVGVLKNNWVDEDILFVSFFASVAFMGVRLSQNLKVMYEENIVLQQEVVENLTKADKLKDSFLANTTHELKKPLDAIISMVDSMGASDDKKNKDDVALNLHLISTSGQRLSRLIDDIVDYADLKQGGITLSFQAVSIDKCLDMVLPVLKPLAQKKNLKIIKDIPVDLPLVKASFERLQQVFYNLLGNAIKFSAEGRIEVKARVRTDSNVEVSIKDYGIGIAPENQAQIFEMFQQVDASIFRTYGGTGIGLSIVNSLIKAHNGKVWVNSELGKGSVFSFTLEQSSEKKSEFKKLDFQPMHVNVDDSLWPIAVKSINDQDKGTILVVDDDQINLQVLLNQLIVEGYQVITASNGPDALEIVEYGDKPDLILLDVMMPGISGFDVCEAVRLKYNASVLPIILLTAKNQAAEFLKGMELGANDFLAKPFSKMELISRIKTHLQLSKLHNSYMRFVPADFLKQINCQNIDELNLGNHLEKELSILVSDIRNFSLFAEKLEAKTVFDILNKYLNKIVPVIRKNNGFIIRFVGDAIVAFFPDGADLAMATAIEINKITKDWKTINPVNQEVIEIDAGIGLHCGKVVLGTIGFDKRMDAAAISHDVDKTVALESYNKLFLSNILISEELWQQCDQKRYRTQTIQKQSPEFQVIINEIRELLGYTVV